MKFVKLQGTSTFNFVFYYLLIYLDWLMNHWEGGNHYNYNNSYNNNININKINISVSIEVNFWTSLQRRLQQTNEILS